MTHLEKEALAAQERQNEHYHAAERDGRLDEAEQGYRDQCDTEPAHARGCYDLARLLLKRDQIESGIARSTQFIEQYRDHALAPAATKRLARIFGDKGRYDDGVNILTALAKAVDPSDVHDSILYEIARLHKTGQNSAAEIATLRQLISQYDRWESQLWDDAIFRLISIHRDRGQIAEQKRLLNELLETKQRSIIIGSYNSPYHDDALAMLAKIQLAEGNFKDAREAFETLAAQETGKLRHEALIGLAEIEFQIGTPDRGCTRLGEVLAEKPRKVLRRRAMALTLTNNCPAP